MAEEKFTLVVVSRDGSGYYKVESDQLGKLNPGSTPEIDEMKERIINAMHIAYPDKGQASPLFFGTFYLNLTVFK